MRATEITSPECSHVAGFEGPTFGTAASHRRRLRKRNLSSLRGTFRFLVAVAACLSGLSRADTLPPENVPLVLLHAPVNLTWAANHTGYWNEKGIAGFLFSGVQDTLDTDVSAKDGDPATVDADDALLREVRLANERLIEAGIDRNFLTVQLAPDAAWFADPALAQKAVERFAALGKFATLAKLRGIAIDPLAQSRFYDSGWKQNIAKGSAVDLAAEAKKLGRRIGLAVLRENDAAEILLFAEEISYWSAPWVAFCEGLLESMDSPNETAPQKSFHLLTKDSFDETGLARLRLLDIRNRRLIELLFDAESKQRWQRRGGVAMGLRPLGCAGSNAAQGERKPVALVPLPEFRSQLAMAKMLSDQYVWIDADGPSWWRVDQKDVDVYQSLLQNGPLMTSQTGPTVENLESYSARTPLDAYRRQGAYDSELGACYALINEKGAGLFLWNGITAEAKLDKQPEPIKMTDIREGTASQVSVEDETPPLKPSEAPVLLADLPTKRWLLPATLWAEPRESPTPQTRNLRVAFGMDNRTSVIISGSLQSVVPGAFAFKPSLLPFELKNGESTRVEGGLAGPFTLGEEIPIRMDILSPGDKPRSRFFSCRTVPPLEWRVSLEGRAKGLAFFPAGAHTPAGLACTTDAGETVWMSPEGTIRWCKRDNESFDQAPVIGSDSQGLPQIATVDSKGNLRVYSSDGALQWEKAPDAWSSPDANQAKSIHVDQPLWTDLDGSPGDELIVATSDGHVYALGGQGNSIWTAPTTPGEHHILSFPDPKRSRRIVCVITSDGTTPGVDAFNNNGTPLWSFPLEGPSQSPPILADVGGDGSLEVITVSNEGIAQARNGPSGIQLVRKKLPLKDRPNWLAAADLKPRSGDETADLVEFLVSDGQNVYCFSNLFEPLWQTDIRSVAPPALMPPGSPTRILVPTESFTEQMCALVGLNDHGDPIWWETRMPTNLSCSPLPADLDADGSPEYLCPTQDRLLSTFK